MFKKNLNKWGKKFLNTYLNSSFYITVSWCFETILINHPIRNSKKKRFHLREYVHITNTSERCKTEPNWIENRSDEKPESPEHYVSSLGCNTSCGYHLLKRSLSMRAEKKKFFFLKSIEILTWRQSLQQHRTSWGWGMVAFLSRNNFMHS